MGNSFHILIPSDGGDLRHLQNCSTRMSQYYPRHLWEPILNMKVPPPSPGYRVRGGFTQYARSTGQKRNEMTVAG